MRKKKRKKYPKQTTKVKEKQAAEDHNTARSGLRAAIIHALSNGWVQNSGIGFLLTVVGLIVALTMKTQVKAAAITFALVGTAAVWILAVVVIQYSKDSPEELAFSLLFKNFDGSRDPHRGAFWYRYSSAYGDTLSPASAALYLTIKNLRPIPLYVERLEVSVQKKGKSWLRLKHIPADAGRMYWIYGDIQKAALLNMATLDQRIHSNIAAGDTAVGWLFLSAPEQYPVAEGDEIRWRLRVKDSSGAEYEHVTEYGTVNNRPEPDNAAAQPVPIVFTGTKEDLSKLFFRMYDPVPYIDDQKSK